MTGLWAKGRARGSDILESYLLIPETGDYINLREGREDLGHIHVHRKDSDP